jgi:iron complex outermembrane receptor protein
MIAVLAFLVQQTPADTARRDTGSVFVARTIVATAPGARPLAGLATAISVVRPADLPGRATQGLDEIFQDVAGIYAANRYNFSLDQRVSIRGFGARSSFGVRGIKVMLDGIPQTLPDGSAQLTNLELSAVDRVEILRGASSALYGNASGGVINIQSNGARPDAVAEELRVSGSSLWNKAASITRVPVGSGALSLVASRLRYTGFRQHSDAELRNLDARYVGFAGPGTVVSATLDYGDDPRADNPGALTAAELAANPDSAAAINITRGAGKNVSQLQGGVSVHRSWQDQGNDLVVSVYAFSRRLRNPQTFAWIDLDRVALGTRLAFSHQFRPSFTVTAGLDAQRQRDDRLNVGNPNGSPDTVRQLDQLEHVTEVGPFLQASWRPAPNLHLLTGLRYDQVSFDVDDRLVTPSNPDDSGRRAMRAPSASLGVEWAPPGGAALYASVGTSFETPTTTELANRPDTAGGFNATLDPQRALSYEVGARRATGTWSWSVALFRAHVRDALVAYQIPSSPGRVFYQNSGHTRHQGLEAALSVWRPLGLAGVMVGAAWTWSDFRYTDYTTRGHVLDGRRLPGIPEHWVHLKAAIRNPAESGPWLELEESLSSSVLVDDTLDIRSAGWQTLDLRAGWIFGAASRRVAPYLALMNAFGRRYVGSVVINAANGRYYEPAPGRNLFVGVTLDVGR